MTSYILTLLSASLAAAVIELLVPKGDGGRIAAYVRMVSGLFLLVALLNPLKEGIHILQAAADGDLAGMMAEQIPSPEPDEYRDAFASTLTSVGKQETESFVTETLESVFGIPPQYHAVEAVLESDGESMALREIRIGLKGKHFLEDPHPMEKFYAERFGGPCYVTVVG